MNNFLLRSLEQNVKRPFGRREGRRIIRFEFQKQEEQIESINFILINMTKWVYYIILLLTCSCMIGMQSSYSIVKHLIGEQFDLSEEDFGIYEMINMATRFVGVVFIVIAPIRRIRFTYIIFLSLQILAYLMICITHFFPTLFSAFFPIANILIGFGTGILMFPYLLLYMCFRDAQRKQSGQRSGQVEFSRCIQTSFNIWLGVGVLGHACALLLGRFIVNDLKLNWVVSLFTFTMIYLFTGLLTLIVPEKKVQLDAEQQNQTTRQKIFVILKTLKNYYKRKASNIVLLFQYCFIDNQANMIVYWVPFFFMQAGFGFDATWIALSYPIGVAIGSFTVCPFVNYFSSSAGVLVSVILFLQAVCSGIFWFIELEEQNLVIFIVLLGLASMFWISPYSRSSQADVLERVHSSKEKYLAVNSMRMGTQILSAIYTLTIGLIMQMNPRNFLFFFTINPMIAFLTHVIRIILEKRQIKEAENQDQSPEEEKPCSRTNKSEKQNSPSQEKIQSNQNLVLVL